MAAVSEWVVREFFEALGYMVAQPCKYVVPARPKSPEEEVDLVVYNPTVRQHTVPTKMVWDAEDLKTVARAVVGVRGWHTDRFYPSTIESTPDIVRFVAPASLQFAARILGADDAARILCLPRLPASGEVKRKTIEVLRKSGIDGVISFHTILGDLVGRVRTNRNYDKSDLLQILRLLKVYDLLKSGQMELFDRRRLRGRARPAPGSGSATEVRPPPEAGP